MGRDRRKERVGEGRAREGDVGFLGLRSREDVRLCPQHEQSAEVWMDRVSSLPLFDEGGSGVILIMVALNSYIDSWDALNETFDELEKEKIIPKSKT